MEVAESEPLESNEQLGCDSPVMWPDQNFCESEQSRDTVVKGKIED